MKKIIAIMLVIGFFSCKKEESTSVENNKSVYIFVETSTTVGMDSSQIIKL